MTMVVRLSGRRDPTFIITLVPIMFKYKESHTQIVAFSMNCTVFRTAKVQTVKWTGVWLTDGVDQSYSSAFK